MRRIVTLLATALMAVAAALTTAPTAVAQAAQAAPTAPTVQTVSPNENCTVRPEGYGYRGTCSGLDPMQTWVLSISCYSYDMNNPGLPVPGPTWLSWAAGNTSTTIGSCPQFSWGVGISFGPAPVAGATGQITGYVNKCLDVRGGSTNNGTPVQMWDCLGNVNQTWRVGVDGTIRAVGKCLDPQSGNTGNGTPVWMWDCNGAISQQWRVRADGAIINVKSGRALDVRGYDTANGAIAQLWDFNNTANQLWHAPA
ncbi:ricin-type beta-trefoil lectin domain protein [Kitasatospora sp. NPDC093806]|uniref:ricin-type beta-trefoil lectin domain protein n=1 Tax=Kitasatospora sp. NPDC093806 TaxID=3155075 RepID=UPI003431EA16